MKDYRKTYGLPQRYFLSLGRMVEKKNLATLVSAYARYAEGVAVAGERLKVKGNDVEKHGAGSVARWNKLRRPRAEEQGVAASETRHSPASLVFVGSGELESALRDRSQAISIQSGENADTENCKLKTANSLEQRSNGFVFDPRSVDALSEALRRIADPLNPKRSTLNAAAMGRRSREIVAKFGCENFAKQALRAALAAQEA